MIAHSELQSLVQEDWFQEPSRLYQGLLRSFWGGVTSYALSVKQAVLGVLQETLDGPGAVSSDCARQMAEGACRVLECNIAVSTTGIAGPGGAEPGKPVGTVWFGICSHGSTQTEVCLFEGDRSSVRKQAVLHALQLLLQALENE